MCMRSLAVAYVRANDWDSLCMRVNALVLMCVETKDVNGLFHLREQSQLVCGSVWTNSLYVGPLVRSQRRRVMPA